MDESGHVLEPVLEVPEEATAGLSPYHVPSKASSSVPPPPPTLAPLDTPRRRFEVKSVDLDVVNDISRAVVDGAPSRKEVARLSEKEGFELEVAEWSTFDVHKCYPEAQDETKHPLSRVLSAERLSRGRSGRLPRLHSSGRESRHSSTGSVRMTDHNECVEGDAMEAPGRSRKNEAYQNHVDRMARTRESTVSAKSLFSRHARLPDIIRRPQLEKKEKPSSGRPSTPTPAASTSAGSRKILRKQARRFSAVSYDQELTDRLYSALSNVHDSDTDTNSDDDAPYSAPARFNLQQPSSTKTGWFEDHTHTAIENGMLAVKSAGSGITPVLTPTLININEDDDSHEARGPDGGEEEKEQETLDQNEDDGERRVRFGKTNDSNSDENEDSGELSSNSESSEPAAYNAPTELDLQVRSSPTVQKYIRWLTGRIISEGYIDVKHIQSNVSRQHENKVNAWTVEHDILFRAMLIVENVLEQVVVFMRTKGQEWDESTAEEAVMYSQSNLNLEEASEQLEALLEEETLGKEDLQRANDGEEGVEVEGNDEGSAEAPQDTNVELSDEDIERMVETLVDIMTSDAAENIAQMNESSSEYPAEKDADVKASLQEKKASKDRLNRKKKKLSRKSKGGKGKIPPVLPPDLPRPTTMTSQENDALSESMKSKFPKLPSIIKKSAEGERGDGVSDDSWIGEENVDDGKAGDNSNEEEQVPVEKGSGVDENSKQNDNTESENLESSERDGGSENEKSPKENPDGKLLENETTGSEEEKVLFGSRMSPLDNFQGDRPSSISGYNESSENGVDETSLDDADQDASVDDQIGTLNNASPKEPDMDPAKETGDDPIAAEQNDSSHQSENEQENGTTLEEKVETETSDAVTEEGKQPDIDNGDEEGEKETQEEPEIVEASAAEQQSSSEATVPTIDPEVPPQNSDVSDPVAELLSQTSQILRSKENEAPMGDLKRPKYTEEEEQEEEKTPKTEGDTGFQSKSSDYDSAEASDEFDRRSLTLSHRHYLEGQTHVPDSPIRSMRSFGNLSFLSLAEADSVYSARNQKKELPLESELD